MWVLGEIDINQLTEGHREVGDVGEVELDMKEGVGLLEPLYIGNFVYNYYFNSIIW